MMKEGGGKVHPEDPLEAWAQLATTRWADMFGVDEFLGRDGLDIKYDRINLAVDPRIVQREVKSTAEREGRLRAMRETLLAQPKPEA